MKEKTMSFGRYCNLTSDTAFKAVFCNENNIELLKSLVNAYMPDGKKVKQLTIGKQEMDGYVLDSKHPRLDLHCVDENGDHILVEIQRVSHTNLFKRMVYYVSSVIYSYLKQGDNWKKGLPPVYLIALCCEKFQEPELNTEHDIVSWYTLMDSEYKTYAPNIINLIFARLYESKTTWEECQTDAERCCYLLSQASKLSKKPEGIEEDSWASAILDAAEEANLSFEDRQNYIRDMMTQYDYYAGIECKCAEARSEGLALGRSEGLALGRSEGLALGRSEGLTDGIAIGEERGEAKGRVEGMVEQSRAIAGNMKRAGMDTETISKMTGLSVEEINQL